MTKFYTYIHWVEGTRPFYVGKGVKGRAKSFSPRNPFYKSTFEKHQGKVSVTLIPALNEEEAFILETALIVAFRSLGYRLTNMTDGGEGSSGRPATEKMLAAFKKYKGANYVSPEGRERQREFMRNRKITQVTRDKLRDRFKGVPRPPHVIEILRDHNTGRPLSEEHKVKAIAGLAKARDKATIWHKSEEGRAWHRQHGANTWKDRVLHTVSCEECEKHYETPFPTRSRFCSGACKSRFGRRMQGKILKPRRGPYKKRVT